MNCLIIDKLDASVLKTGQFDDLSHNRAKYFAQSKRFCYISNFHSYDYEISARIQYFNISLLVACRYSTLILFLHLGKKIWVNWVGHFCAKLYLISPKTLGTRRLCASSRLTAFDPVPLNSCSCQSLQVPVFAVHTINQIDRLGYCRTRADRIDLIPSRWIPRLTSHIQGWF